MHNRRRSESGESGRDKEPLPSTVYERVGGQIIEEADPIARKGMQAGVTLTANSTTTTRKDSMLLCNFVIVRLLYKNVR